MNIDNAINLTNCDKEPIHLLGKLQSLGHLLAISNDTLEIKYVSEDLHFLFNLPAAEIFRMRISDRFDKAFIKSLNRFIHGKRKNITYHQPVLLEGIYYKVIFAASNTFTIIELETITDQKAHYLEVHKGNSFLEDAISSINNSTSEKQLVNNAAVLFREFTGFDRVMVYKFDENGDGEVIAEDKTFGLDSFLGLNYPASDIPKQARKLYLSNKVRAIHDVNDEGKLIYSKDNISAADQLDLSYSVFRSVSPIHLQYLKNMGVTATHGVSLIINNELWGMLICHHYEGPKFLSINERVTTLLFGDFFSNSVELLSNGHERKEMALLTDMIDQLKYENSKKESLSEVLYKNWELIANIFNCQGLVLRSGDEVISIGDHVNEVALHQLSQKLKVENQQIYATKSIHSLGFDEVLDLPYAGFLRIIISESLDTEIFLLRKEKKRVINWAGNPHKPIEVNFDDVTKLSPRNSFAKWEQKVENESYEWFSKDLNLAKILRESLISFEMERLNQRFVKNEKSTRYFESLLNERNQELSTLNQQLELQLKENKIIQNTLEIAKNSAEYMNKVKSGFLANLSHEMRTPLNGIMGLSLIINQKTERDEIRNFANLQIESSERLLKTLNRILEMAKIENNAIEHTFGLIDLDNLMKEVIRPLHILAAQKEQRLQVVNHEKSKKIISDQLILEQIITNLVSNAIKYTPNGGNIQINVKTITQDLIEYLNITIEDNGIGIAKEHINKIYDPFYMENEVTKQKDNSSGLGLFLVKKYTQYLRGEITLESKKDIGTIFTVKIPLEEKNNHL
ncbi:MAG TPA: ATP-binding protein [Anditalea sp.]|nr:ATP-binding protein [Anditalea sp.]